MSWASLVLVIMKAAASSLAILQERKLIEAGQDKEIAKAALKLLEVTEAGKALRAKIAAMSDDDAEKLWKDMVE